MNPLLANYAAGRFARVFRRLTRRTRQNDISHALEVFVSRNAIRFVDFGGYESRHRSTIRMLSDAWYSYPPTNKRTLKRRISTDDTWSERHDLSYAITNPRFIKRGLPHFAFESWPEVGIPNGAQMFDELFHAGSRMYQDKRAFWIGAETNALRRECCELAASHTDIMDFRLLSWNRADPSRLYANTADYVTLTQHCRYRVLVDLTARGFSARLPYLLAAGRPLIVLDRTHESWFWWDKTLVPWVHYIPGGSKPESLLLAVQWTFKNPGEADKIGINGREYAKKYLSYSAVIQRCAEVVWGSGESL